MPEQESLIAERLDWDDTVGRLTGLRVPAHRIYGAMRMSLIHGTGLAVRHDGCGIDVVYKLEATTILAGSVLGAHWKITELPSPQARPRYSSPLDAYYQPFAGAERQRAIDDAFRAISTARDPQAALARLYDTAYRDGVQRVGG